MELYGLYGRVDLCVSAELRPGDEEGSVEFAILKADQHLVTVNLLVSGKRDCVYLQGPITTTYWPLDTSDYPESHQFYAFALEADGLPDHVPAVIEGIADRPPRTLEETIRRLTLDLARAESQGESSDEDEEETSDEGELDGDLDYGYETGMTQPTHFEMEQLRK